MTSRSFTIPGGAIRRALPFVVRQIDASGGLALLRPSLRPPKAIVRETIREIAKADLRSVFGRQSSEPI